MISVLDYLLAQVFQALYMATICYINVLAMTKPSALNLQKEFEINQVDRMGGTPLEVLD